MDVVFTLSNLLFSHDRVVVNGLGIFTAELEKAYIHPVEHSFSPDFKKIKFQADADTKDDLLSQSLGCENADDLISDFVLDIHSQLKEGNKVQLKNIGFIYRHHTGEIILEQDLSFNYVKKNFGMQPIIQEPVNKIVASKALIAAPIVKAKQTKSRMGFYFLAIAAVIVVLFAFWKMDAIKHYFNQISDQQIAETNVVMDDEPVVTQMQNHSPNESVEEPVLQQDTLVNDSNVQAGVETITESKVEKMKSVEETKEKDPEPVEVNIKSPAQGAVYYVIAGCFRSEYKANRLLNKLKVEGFENASIEGKTPNGLIRVCYASYPKRRQASNYMLKLQNTGRKGVWIQKK